MNAITNGDNGNLSNDMDSVHHEGEVNASPRNAASAIVTTNIIGSVVLPETPQACVEEHGGDGLRRPRVRKSEIRLRLIDKQRDKAVENVRLIAQLSVRRNQ